MKSGWIDYFSSRASIKYMASELMYPNREASSNVAAHVWKQ